MELQKTIVMAENSVSLRSTAQTEKGQVTMPIKENKPKSVYKYEHQTVDEIMADLQGIANRGIIETFAQDYEKDKADKLAARIMRGLKNGK